MATFSQQNAVHLCSPLFKKVTTPSVAHAFGTQEAAAFLAQGVCVCVRVRVSVRVCACVCVCVRERERESVCMVHAFCTQEAAAYLA